MVRIPCWWNANRRKEFLIEFQNIEVPAEFKRSWSNISMMSILQQRVYGAFTYVLMSFTCLGLCSLAFGQAAVSPKFAIAIHGGAGLEPNKLSVNDRRLQEEALRKALKVGSDMLSRGANALDAVEQTIRALEDEPLYNAGRGAVFNNLGKHELDAAIADGRTHKAGAVAGVRTVKNPISLARLVMTQTNHVLLMGDGAEKFADEMKEQAAIERVANEYFSTEHRRREWMEAVEREQNQPQLQKSDRGTGGKGTVGCVALDQHGNLAAGTSTGGLTNKKWGRVGAVPIIGAGTFADSATCAISGTGIGEHFMLHSVAFQIHALMKFRSLSLAAAVEEVVDHVLDTDTAGIIAVDSQGNIVLRCNTPGMARASTDSSGKIVVLLDR